MLRAHNQRKGAWDGDVLRGRRSKFTKQQIAMCRKHLEDGKSLRKTANLLGPDWDMSTVYHYKKKFAKR